MQRPYVAIFAKKYLFVTHSPLLHYSMFSRPYKADVVLIVSHVGPRSSVFANWADTANHNAKSLQNPL
jgi:hypothetical protein